MQYHHMQCSLYRISDRVGLVFLCTHHTFILSLSLSLSLFICHHHDHHRHRVHHSSLSLSLSHTHTDIYTHTYTRQSYVQYSLSLSHTHYRHTGTLSAAQLLNRIVLARPHCESGIAPRPRSGDASKVRFGDLGRRLSSADNINRGTPEANRAKSDGFSLHCLNRGDRVVRFRVMYPATDQDGGALSRETEEAVSMISLVDKMGSDCKDSFSNDRGGMSRLEWGGGGKSHLKISSQ